MKLFVFGLGYSAKAIIARLRPEITEVWGTTRSPDKLEAIKVLGVSPLLFPDPHALPPQEERERALPFPSWGGAGGGVRVIPESLKIPATLVQATHVLVSIAPDEHGDPVLNTHRDALAAVSPQSIVYLSTIGVYGDHDGAWVDELSSLKPVSRRSRQRVDAEAAWRNFAEETGVPVALIRLAGIYGPGRGPFEKIRRGTARRIVKPAQVFNRIHVDDIAAIVAAAFARRAVGPFNGADDEPAPPEDVLAYAAELLATPPPPAVPFADAEMTEMARTFYGENKRVRNERIKDELGVRLAYPTFREGLRAVMEAERHALP